MKKILLLFFSLLVSIDAMESYQTYRYLDKHKVKTTMQDNVSNQFLEINGTLHVRYIEDNQTEYLIFWLENGTREQKKLDINSIYIPPCKEYQTDEYEIRDCLEEYIKTEELKRVKNNDFNWYPRLDCKKYFDDNFCKELNSY